MTLTLNNTTNKPQAEKVVTMSNLTGIWGTSLLIYHSGSCGDGEDNLAELALSGERHGEAVRGGSLRNSGCPCQACCQWHHKWTVHYMCRSISMSNHRVDRECIVGALTPVLRLCSAAPPGPHALRTLTFDMARGPSMRLLNPASLVGEKGIFEVASIFI